MVTYTRVFAALWLLVPYLAAAFFGRTLASWVERWPLWVRLAAPSGLAFAYALVAASAEVFRWGWLAVYAAIPVSIAGLMAWARVRDPERRGSWADALVLGAVGMAVDLRWLERAWPPHLSVFNKILLLDAGIYGILLVRRLEGVGFSLRLRLRDVKVGLRELALYAPAAALLGLALRFLHWHPGAPWMRQVPGAFGFTFLFIALPEELFFRGWMQNLLERRMGRSRALAVTAVLFGLAHFNKRTVGFNWRYVLLAALAGVFYGRAWRQERRVGASALTHACVDTIWSVWLR